MQTSFLSSKNGRLLGIALLIANFAFCFHIWSAKSIPAHTSSNYFTNTNGAQNNLRWLPALASTENNQKKKLIALSFDDGPNGKYTEAVLAILKENNAKATFFVCGDSTAAAPNLVKQEYAAGNEIGNHTYSHVNIAKLSENNLKKELTKANEEIYKAINVYPVLFRPPYGASSARANQVLAQLGFKKITWNYMVNDFDTKKTSADKIASEVITHAHPGAIIDMHDGGGNRDKTIAALPVIIKALKKQGYEFVTVSTIVKVNPYRN
jgi:peptidoglycan/xylan/chitin deacetylase (PgdA/CDA1 family)